MAESIYEKSCRMHKKYQGKIAIIPKCPVDSAEDLAVWYTPGVAEPCREIHKNPEKSYVYTARQNMAAVVSDGTRVLGLGNIGPEAAMPVMEGKALLFKHYGGVDAFPLCIGTTDEDNIVNFCKWIAPSFGAINLEDIEAPKCFSILERLRNELSIPVWHDDQQGTATVTLAACINALKIVNKDIRAVKLAFVGAGAANSAIFRLLRLAGMNPETAVMADADGTLGTHRSDYTDIYRQEICRISNKTGVLGGIKEALTGADVCIALSKPGPDTIKPQWIQGMADNPVVFACANPVPEILPEDARAAGAKVVATGRSDFSNQVNNSLCFPGVFRGILDCRAQTITDTMCVKIACAIAGFAEKNGLSADYIVPGMDEPGLHKMVAQSTIQAARDEGLA